MGLYDPELNDWKILWNEAMTGFGHPSGLVDTLNRMAARIYNLLRREVIHADGTNKIQAFNSKIADAGGPFSFSGEQDFGDPFAFTISDNQAVITGHLSTNIGLEETNEQNENTVFRIYVDGVLNPGTGSRELWYDCHNASAGGNHRVQERTVAMGFSASISGAGLHTVQVTWTTGTQSDFDIENGVFLQGFILQNQTLVS